MFLFVNLLFLTCVFVTTTANEHQCEDGWSKLGGSCYLLTDAHPSYRSGPSHLEAGYTCENRFGYLAEMDTEEENDLIKNWLSLSDIPESTAGIWLGGTDFLGLDRWSWDSSEELATFSDWADHQGKQSGKCLSMSPQYDFSWVPEDCRKQRNMMYLCERPCDMEDQCFQGSCYSLSCATYKAKTTEQKSYECPRGSLVKIETEAENNFIYKFLANTTADQVNVKVWTAGHGVWRWQGSDSTPVAFNDWEYQPDEKCIALSRNDYDEWSWTEKSCEDKYPILCEYPDPATSGDTGDQDP